MGFNSQCVVDVDHALQDFDRLKFWKEILGLNEFYRPCTNDIQHPTLHFMQNGYDLPCFLDLILAL